jgi:hypothetical protein
MGMIVLAILALIVAIAAMLLNVPSALVALRQLDRECEPDDEWSWPKR